MCKDESAGTLGIKSWRKNDFLEKMNLQVPWGSNVLLNELFPHLTQKFKIYAENSREKLLIEFAYNLRG